jgi:uncharacterized protein YjdB
MNCRRFLFTLSLVVVTMSFVNCVVYKKTGLAISPTSANIATGGTIQFTAIEQSNTHSKTKTNDVTSQVSWASDNTAAVTVSATGLATSVGEGIANITATTKGSDGPLIAHAIVTAEGHDLQSVTIIPTVQTLYATGETAQFIAIGTFNSAPTTEDITDLVSGFPRT